MPDGETMGGGLNVAGHKISTPVILLVVGGAALVFILLKGGGGGGGATAPAIYTTSGGQGPVGATGATGEAGAAGQSAYEIAQSQGFTGTIQDFLNSLVGKQGATGATGATGAQGAQGLQGIAGQNADPAAVLAQLNKELATYLSGLYVGYQVKSGDTWQSIASRFGITVDQLRALQPRVANLNVGQSLFVPAPKFA